MHKRSRKLRKVFVKTPKGTKIVYKRKKPSLPKCAICKKPLHGIKRLIPSKFKKLSKSKRRPQRPYASNLCFKCTKRVLIQKTRK